MKENGILNRILHLAVKDPQNPESQRDRTAIGKLAGVLGIVCNLLLAGSKILVGALASSMSILADGLNNLSDAASSIVTLVGFRLAEKPADDAHPYGHARYEYLSGLAVSAMMIVIGFELGKGSLEKILHPSAVEFSTVACAVLVLSILVKLGLFWLNAALAEKIHSGALKATSADSRNDVITTTAVLFAALTEHFLSWKIDGYVGMAVSVFILYSGAKLARETISPLLGESANPELQKTIEDCIRACPKVLGCHDLMVHDYGVGQRFASVHVEMDRREDPLICHELIDEIERNCLAQHGVHLVIHYDPVVTDDPELERLKKVVAADLKILDPQISIHDFRMIPGEQHVNLIFDLALPMHLKGKEREIQTSLENALNCLGNTTYHTVITFDSLAFNRL